MIDTRSKTLPFLSVLRQVRAQVRGAPRRVCQALMPDYNAKAAAYWWTAVALGAAILGYAVQTLAAQPATQAPLMTIIAAIAVLAAFFPVRIPQSKHSYAAGEIFIFLLLLLHGPAAATLTAAAEAMVGSWRTSRRWTSRIASPAMAAIAMFSTGSMLHVLLQAGQRRDIAGPGLLIASSMLFSLAYFLCNTLLMTTVLRLKADKRFEWSQVLGASGWVGVAFAGSAAVAALLYLSYLQSGSSVLIAGVPAAAMMLATLHYYLRQQEAAEAVRREASKAARREAHAAARHLRELHASERRFQCAFTHAFIGMALLDAEGRVAQSNGAMRALLGVDEATLRLGSFDRFIDAAHREPLREHFSRVIDRHCEGVTIDLKCRRSDGREVWVAAHCTVFSERGAEVPSLILQVQDITARRAAEVELRELAFRDTLTGLPNRRHFDGCLAQAVERSKSHPHFRFAVMFLDFDRFKVINDSLGHAAGDEFLVQVARRAQHSLRPNDVVARLGGDEFAFLVQDIDHLDDAVAFAERVLATVRRPFNVAGTVVNASASIGVAYSAAGYESPEAVLRDADIAMYRAKAAGQDSYAVFDTSLHTAVADRLQLERDLRAAIDTGQVWVAYQPLFDIGTHRIVGFEALARWSHPLRGPIGPHIFVPVAEECGLIGRLTALVLDRACGELARWTLLDPALSMHVNVSGKDLAKPDLPTLVCNAIARTGIDARQLTIEIAESSLVESVEAARKTMVALRTLGVRISIDHFGTGYLSLARIGSLPIDSLKVDRSFIAGLGSDSNQWVITRAIVTLGLSLGTEVIAEGVENAAQLQQLRAMGCRTGQGNAMSRAVTAEAASALLLEGLGRRAAACVQAPHA